MAQNLIIFGAGASYGSDSSGVPPLTTDLFDTLASFNPPGWGRLDTAWADEFRQDFEAAVRKLSEANAHAMAPLQRAMAAFFFNFRPGPNSLYVALAKAIAGNRWDGALGTLNYERLLELSLLSQGVQPFIGHPPSHLSRVELCLPHGCCHIFSSAVRGSARGISFSGPNIRTSGGKPEVIGDPEQFRQRIENDAFPPIMSHPLSLSEM